MDTFPTTVEIVSRLGLSVLLGGVIGWEREWRGKAAGLRTHMLVSLGAAAFSLLALELYSTVVDSGHAPARVDPIRIVEGVISGIGFLGAGAIIRDGGSVEGLTTAGNLWLAGALGLAAGGGQWVVATVVAVLAIIVLYGFGIFERFVFPRKAKGQGKATDQTS